MRPNVVEQKSPNPARESVGERGFLKAIEGINDLVFESVDYAEAYANEVLLELGISRPVRVELSYERPKRRNGTYFHNGRIVIYKPRWTLKTLLHEVCHHAQYERDGYTKHDKRFRWWLRKAFVVAYADLNMTMPFVSATSKSSMPALGTTIRFKGRKGKTITARVVKRNSTKYKAEAEGGVVWTIPATMPVEVVA